MRYDLTRTEYGSVEAEVLSVISHHGLDAVIAVKRLSGEKFVGVLSDEVANTIGPDHSWSEVWGSTRVIITGALHYDEAGTLKKVDVQEIETHESVEVDLSEVRKPGSLSSVPPIEHLDRLWGEGR